MADMVGENVKEMLILINIYTVLQPPGVGKTMLLQAVISELLKEKAKCYRVSVYEILSILNKFPVR